MKKCCRQLKVKAFTLIELLVALSILMILAAILLPAFSRARQRPAASCLGNLRQIGFANLQYAQDYDGGITPAVTAFNVNAGGSLSWLQLLSPYLNNANPNPNSLNSVFGCPDDQQTLFFDGVTTDYISYSVNGFVTGDYSGGGGPGEVSLHLSQIERPREVMFAGDGNKAEPYGWGGGGFTPDDWVRAGNISGDDGNGVVDATCVHMGAAYSDGCVNFVKNWIHEDHYLYDPSGGSSPPSPYACANNSGVKYNDQWVCKAPAYRHRRTGMYTGLANFTFLDGHAHTFHFGEPRTWNFIPNESAAQRAL